MGVRETLFGGKQLNDGAVSARYRAAAPAQESARKTAKTRTAQLKNAQANDEDAQKKPAARRQGAKKDSEKKRAEEKRTEKKRTEKKPSEKKITEKKTAEKKTAEKKAADKNAPEKAAAETRTARKKAAEKTSGRRGGETYTASVRRREKPARESGREKRDKKRIEAQMRDRRRAVRCGVDMKVTVIALLTALFEALGMLLAAAAEPGAMNMQAMRIMGLIVPLGLVTSLVLPRFMPMDALIMALTNFLCGVGVVILYTVSPERGALQAQYYALGIAAMLIVALVVSRMRRVKALTWISMVLGIGALILPLAFGEWVSGAKNWVYLPVVGSFQPSELVKLSLVLSMAYYFSAHRTVFQMMPAILFAGACLLLLMLQRDLGTALIYYATTLALFYAACGNLPLTLIGFGGGAGAALLGYQMFAHVKARVAMWRNPWSDPLDKGYQIIQALLAIGSGGLFGVGLGQGTPEKIPAYFNDFIFAVICEQLGLVFGLLVIAVYLLLILRGVSVTSRSRRSFDLLLGCGVVAMLGIQTFMIVGGVIKMIPLTGVTMPFLSYGGSSLLSCLMMIGVLHGIAGRAQAELEEELFCIKC